MQIVYNSIGLIQTPFKDTENMPIQPLSINSAKGIVVINEKYIDGLIDLEGFSHIILIYHFHKVTTQKLKVVPFLDDKEHGVFATRSPIRINPIGMSIVKLEKIEKNILYINDVDILDNTPLLDIKPFFEKFDNRFLTNSGWLEEKENINLKKSDNRFKI